MGIDADKLLSDITDTILFMEFTFTKMGDAWDLVWAQMKLQFYNAIGGLKLAWNDFMHWLGVRDDQEHMNIADKILSDADRKALEDRVNKLAEKIGTTFEKFREDKLKEFNASRLRDAENTVKAILKVVMGLGGSMLKPIDDTTDKISGALGLIEKQSHKTEAAISGSADALARIAEYTDKVTAGNAIAPDIGNRGEIRRGRDKGFRGLFPQDQLQPFNNEPPGGWEAKAEQDKEAIRQREETKQILGDIRSSLREFLRSAGIEIHPLALLPE
jgi:hypothetical protein